MPGETGVTVVTMLVCLFLFCTRGCGRSGRPAFPAPSEFRGQDLQVNLARTRGEIAESHLDVIGEEGSDKAIQNRATRALDCFAEHVIRRAKPRRTGDLACAECDGAVQGT